MEFRREQGLGGALGEKSQADPDRAASAAPKGKELVTQSDSEMPSLYTRCHLPLRGAHAFPPIALRLNSMCLYRYLSLLDNISDLTVSLSV